MQKWNSLIGGNFGAIELAEGFHLVKEFFIFFYDLF